MHPPPKDRHVWVPKSKTTTAAAAENETPSSSSSSKITQNASSRITRAITRAVSTILPSPSSRHSNQATQNTPSPGLSSILSRRVACEPTTSSDANKETTPGATPSKATNNRRSVRKETTTPNPISRTNLLTATPTFKDAGNYNRKPPLIPIVGNYSRNPIPPVNDSRKGKRSTVIRSARKAAAAPSRPDLHVPNSADKVSGGGSSRVSGHSKDVNLTSDQQKPQNVVHRASASKSLANVSASDPKGKGAVTSGNQAFKRKALDNKSAYRSYEQLLKDHYISSSDSSQIELGPIPLGEKCQLCAIDLAFLPYNSSSGTSTDPPMCAILPCGHALHASCLEQVYGSSLEPQCLSCALGSPKLGK